MTDARYFAARFTDVLALPWDGSAQNIEFLATMRSWIVGVNWAIEVTGVLTDKDFEVMKSEDLDHCILHDQINANIPHSICQWVILSSDYLADEARKILRNKDLRGVIVSFDWLKKKKNSLPSQFQVEAPLWVEIETCNHLRELGDLEIVEGIVLSGSPEEKTGVKSYESLDQIFEDLEALS